MPGRTAIVGGYGHVGSLVARALRARAHDVVVAGRSLDRARRAAVELGAAAARLDLEQPDGWDAALDGVDRVLVCIDPPDERFARRVLERGIDYVDVTASDGYLRRVESLHDVAVRSGAAAILSVGLAPGLTNLLVREAAGALDEAHAARIAIRLGLGDAHGPAAIAWTLEQVASLRDPVTLARVRFEPGAAPLAAGPFDFADQHVVRRTLGLRDAATFLAVESELWTRLLFGSRRLLRSPRVRRWLTSWLPRVRLGSDACALAVEVDGLRDGRSATVRAGFRGRREASVTAAIAAHVVEALPSARRPGVHHIEQRLAIADLREVIAGIGGTTWIESASTGST